MSNVVNKKPSRTEYLAALRNKMQESSSPKNNQKQDDERFWKAERDASGQGSAIIRFLPAKSGEAFPYVQMWTHGFQGPTSKWFIDNCPTSIGEQCPVCKANTALWAAGKEGSPEHKLASSRKRKLIYISNILVITDPKHPENNGKVFLYKYGKKIFDKAKEMVDPPAEFAESPIDPFDAEEGVNFKLRITKQDNFPNYDRSSFDTIPAPIGDEDYRAEILSQLYSLDELIDPSHFKSYPDLKKRFDMVTGENTADDYEDKPELATPEAEDETPASAPKAAPAPKATTKTTPKAAAAKTAPADDSDDFFANLAKQSDGV